MIRRNLLKATHSGRIVYLDRVGENISRVCIVGPSKKPDYIDVDLIIETDLNQTSNGAPTRRISVKCEDLKWGMIRLSYTQAKSKYPTLPYRILGSLYAYVEHLCPTGDFLLAVLCNRLYESMARADDEMKNILGDLVAFVFNELPSNCWGSQDAVTRWLNGLATPIYRKPEEIVPD